MADLYGDLPEAKFTPADDPHRTPSFSNRKAEPADNGSGNHAAAHAAPVSKAAPFHLVPLMPLALKQKKKTAPPSSSTAPAAVVTPLFVATMAPSKPKERTREEELLAVIEDIVNPLMPAEDDLFPSAPLASSLPRPQFYQHDHHSAAADAALEYDPWRPNDYTDCRRRRQQQEQEKRQEAKQLREEQERRKQTPQEGVGGGTRMDEDNGGGFQTEPLQALPSSSSSSASSCSSSSSSSSSVSILSLGLARGRGGVDMRPAWMKQQQQEQQEQQEQHPKSTPMDVVDQRDGHSNTNAAPAASTASTATIEVSALIAAALQKAQQQQLQPGPAGTQASPANLFAARLKLGPQSAAGLAGSSTAAVIKGFSHISDKAKLMMARMGYKEGKGLGKNEGGIVEALRHVKTGTTSGVIRGGGGKTFVRAGGGGGRPSSSTAGAGAGAGVGGGWESEYGGGPGLGGGGGGREAEGAGAGAAAGLGADKGKTAGAFVAATSSLASSSSASASSTSSQPGAPLASRVVLLRNLVGAGEVDDELEEEVTEEASRKFGSVKQVLIFECLMPTTQQQEQQPQESTPFIAPEDAVRIFVEFTEVQSAIKAKEGFNGRFFGKRQVTAELFDEGRYERLDLAPD